MPPIVSYANIVERLRRAFGLVGDVDVVPKPDLNNTVLVADLTSPGHASFRGRRFLSWQTLTAAAANSYNGIKASETVVIESLFIASNASATLITFSLLPPPLADGAGWNWTTLVPFCERVLSQNDFAPVSRMAGYVAAPPAVPGLQLGTASFANNVGAGYEVLRTPMVLQSGDRLVWFNATAGATLTVGVGGYVF